MIGFFLDVLHLVAAGALSLLGLDYERPADCETAFSPAAHVAQVRFLEPGEHPAAPPAPNAAEASRGGDYVLVDCAAAPSLPEVRIQRI